MSSASVNKRKRDEESPLVRSDATKALERSSLVSAEEVSFPRGGASSLTPLELKQVANEAANDVLFDLKNKSKSHSAALERPKKKKKIAKETKNDGAIEEEAEEDETASIIQHINFKNLQNDSILLGQITQITKEDLCVSFTDNISGYVSITHISNQITALLEEIDEDMESSEDDGEAEYESDNEKNSAEKELPNLKKYFRLGQWLRCSVVKNSSLDASSKNKKRIELSIEPSVVNKSFTKEDLSKNTTIQCSVKSLEDHGAILDTGVKDISGFISKADIPSFEKLLPGSVLLANITKSSGRSINVNLDFGAKNNKVTQISSVDAILPGQNVDLLIETVTSYGIIGKVFGLVKCFINVNHLRCFDIESLQHKFAVGSNIKCRIIASLINKNGEPVLISSTLDNERYLKDTLPEKDAITAFPIGYTFDNCSIVGRDAQFFYLKLNDDLFGSVHYSKMGDNIDMSSTTIKARVLGFNSLDNIYQLTTDSDIIDLKYIRAVDIPVGELLPNCEVVSVSNNGMELKILNGQYKAFVPKLHISDIKLMYPERKFKIGSKIKARVLNVDDRGHIFVTVKKSLVNEENLKLITSFKIAQEIQKSNEKTLATVQTFKPNGCVISFFGGVRGFLPNSEISEAYVTKPEQHLRMGQTVQIKLLEVDQERFRIIATCKISNDDGLTKKTEIEQMVLGRSIVEATVVEKTKDSIIVETTESQLRGVIYVGHLGDLKIEQCRAAIKKIKIGSLVNGLVIDKDNRTQVFNLTLKESLIKDAKKESLPLSFADVQKLSKSTPIHGYVKSVSEKGVFVAFNGKFVGLVLPSYAVENRDVNISQSFTVNQSVTTHVLRLDEDNKRFLLTLKTPKEAKKDTKKANDKIYAINAVDESMKILGDFKLGSIVKAKIKNVKKNQLNITLADNLHGRVDVAEIYDSYEDIENAQQPLSSFKAGNFVTVKIIGSHDIKTHKFLPISHTVSNNSILELTMKPSKMKQDNVEIQSLQDIKVGESTLAFVNNYTKSALWLTISPSVKAKISLFDLKGHDIENIDDEFPLGCALKINISSIDKEHAFAVATVDANVIKSIEDVKVGDVLPSRIMKVTNKYVLLDLGHKLTGISFATEALDNFSYTLEETFGGRLNDVISASVLTVDKENKKINLSLRSKNSEHPSIFSHTDIKKGDVIHALIKNVTDKGIFVYLSSKLEAFIPVSKLSDSYLKDWKKFYKPLQHVIGKVVSCENDERILLTLRESEVNGELQTLKNYDNIEVGEIFNGSVKNVTDFGVFVKLDNAVNVTGLAHKTEIADNIPQDLSTLFGVGDRVKAKILRVNPEKKQISLGLKASYFASTENETDKKDTTTEVESDKEDEIMDIDYNNDSEDDDIDMTTDEKIKTPMSTDGLSLSTGFDWTASILDQAQEVEESEEDEDFTETRKHKHKANKKHTEDKTLDINTRAPESVADFERLIMGNPNSSVIWMNYMAFQLQLSEIEKAREIAQRALKTIGFREESEKLNIWIALLNLENTFGTEENLEQTFKDACQYMDSYTIHTKLLGIYQLSEKTEKADELFKATAKKFGSERVAIWVLWGEYLLAQKRNSEARSILAKALKSLPKRDHIEVVKKFALLEFSKGDAERGRSLFEGLLSDAPKRIDLWNVYIDQEIKINEKKKVEDLFERVFTKKVSRKQAKFFFNKWLSFEESQNDEKMAAIVKSKAADFVKEN